MARENKTEKKSGTKKTKEESPRLDSHDVASGTWTIFSCMRKDMYMWVGEGKKRRLVQIPAAPSPELLYSPESPQQKTVLVPRVGGNSASSTGVLREYEEMKTLGVLQEPLAIPNTIYLVEAEDILQFPDRTDFYTPATYELVKRSDVEKFVEAEEKISMKKKKRKKASQKKKNKYAFDINVVASVTRIPYGKKEKDSPVFDDAYFVEKMKQTEDIGENE